MGVNKTLQGWNSMQMRFALIIFTSLFAGLFAFTYDTPANAATTLPTKMNFQGRVTNSSGNILANGTYNMRFKIFNAATAGTQQWSEDRLVSATQGVVVTNGQFSVQLGSVTSLPASVFASNTLYFEVELPTPASATTSSPVWTEGAMTPRNQLATSAYAYNSETLDGLDSAAFGQLSQNNTFTGNNTFNGTLQGGSSLTLGTAAAQGSLVLNDGNGQTGTLRMADTAGNYFYTIPVTTANDTFCLQTLANCASGGGFSAIGTYSTTNTDAKGVTVSGSSLIFQDASATAPGMVGIFSQTFAGNKTFTGTLSVGGVVTFDSTLTVGTSTNGVILGGTGVSLTGTARGSIKVTLAPEYSGATFVGDGTNNTGSLSSDFCSHSALLNINPTVCPAVSNEHNYYAWSNTLATAQDYGIYVRYQIPSDYDTGSMTNLSLTAMGSTGAGEIATLAMFKGSASACATTADAITANNTWAAATVASPLGACTIVADDIVTFRVNLTATQNQTARAGAISFSYRSKF